MKAILNLNCSALFVLLTISLRTCLKELKEQADSDGNFIGKTFEQLRELYAEKYPEYFEEDDLEFEAPIQGLGLMEADEKLRRLEVLKDFLSGKSQTIVWSLVLERNFKQQINLLNLEIRGRTQFGLFAHFGFLWRIGAENSQPGSQGHREKNLERGCKIL